MFKVVATRTEDNTHEVIMSAYLVTKEGDITVVKYTDECLCCGQVEHRERRYNSKTWKLDFDPKKRSTGGRQSV